MVEWQASAFVFLGWSVLRKPNSTTKADVFPLHFGEGIDVVKQKVRRFEGEVVIWIVWFVHSSL